MALLPMVERVARDVRWMFAPHLDLRDLTQAGCVGLTKAGSAFSPARASAAGFESYAYFRVRGAIIDSQKRRTYREEQNLSLERPCGARNSALAETTLLDFIPDRAPSSLVLAEREQIHRILARAIEALPEFERTALRGQLAGQSLAVTARQMGRSMTWTRLKLSTAREMVGVTMRGE